MKISIRLAVPSDAPDMAEVLMRSWEVAYRDIIPAEYIREKSATRHDSFKRIITDENSTQYVIQTDGKTVGIMGINPTPHDDDLDDDIAELESIYLHPDWYRQGIGSQAMDFAYEVARRAGKTAIVLWVFAGNTNSIKFYEKCGFSADGKTKTYDIGKVMDCIRMRRGL